MTAAVASHAALAPRVRPSEGLRQSASLSWRTLVQIKHNPMELIDFSLQPIMFLLLFTYVFGGAIAGSTGDYLTFALPGLIVQNALFGTLNTGVGMCNDLTKGVFDRLRALPIARWAPLTGRIVADIVKQAWAMALLLGLGAIMGFRVGTSVAAVLGAFGVLLAVVLAFSWVSVLVGVLVREPERVMVFGFAVMFPLTFVSNVFVPANTMPGWLRSFVDVNPVTIVANAIRGLLVEGPVATPVLQALAWAAGFLAVFGPLAVHAFRKRT
ncbi:ABC transporter permease [Actinophytocola sp.]|uniref:ABC transporter permease n=1 Tax=Actinophytocola sp. TaxID=1872138 RepID=UPI00389A1E3E